MNNILKRLDGETENQTLWRVGNAKASGVLGDITWPEVAEFMNKEFRDDEEIQRGYGRSISPQTGSQRRTGQGQEREGKKIEETGCGYQPAMGGKILTNTMKAMTHNAPWPIFCYGAKGSLK